MRRRTILALGVASPAASPAATACSMDSVTADRTTISDRLRRWKPITTLCTLVTSIERTATSPDGSLPTLTESRIEERYEIEATTDATVVDRENESATISVELTADTNEDGTWTAEDTYLLRQHEGN